MKKTCKRRQRGEQGRKGGEGRGEENKVGIIRSRLSFGLRNNIEGNIMRERREKTRPRRREYEGRR